MTPLDVIIWAGAIAVAVVLVGVASAVAANAIKSIFAPSKKDEQ